MTDEDLEAATAAGIITPAQLVALRAFRATPKLEADEEHFRLLGGFNDILVAIGLGLLMAGLFSATSAGGNPLILVIVSMAAAWGLAEFFTRRLRLALPSILLAVMFAGSVGLFGAVLTNWKNGPDLLNAGACLATAAAALVHYWRFRVPISVAIAVAGLCGAIATVFVQIDGNSNRLAYATLVLGLAVFAFAMRFDLADPRRISRTADIGFWLHLLAAPLVVHSILAGIVLGNSAEAPLILALFAVFAFVAIVIDRRAMLVSGLSYAGYSLASLFGTLGSGSQTSVAITLLTLALLVLSVSAGWRYLRALILPLLPLGTLRERLPPVMR